MQDGTQPIRILIVYGSAVGRKVLAQHFSAEPDMTVMATAGDPFVAVHRIEDELPDAIVLDCETPNMDGMTFLRKLMAQCPIPVVLCMSAADDFAARAAAARKVGAAEIFAKPPRLDIYRPNDGLSDLSRLVRAAVARARPHGQPPATAAPPAAGLSQRIGTRLTAHPLADPPPKLSADVILPAPGNGDVPVRTDTVVCIGASTGGTETLYEILRALPENAPGIVVVQHMPERFTASFARHLDNLCTVHVKEAEDGDAVVRGGVLIAPGNHHTILCRNGTRYGVRVVDGPAVSRHRPSVDVLFRSAALSAGANAVGILLTGMGDDGAQGLLEMRSSGALTIAQDEASSVVFGMPKEAIALGAATMVKPLPAIAREILAADREHAGGSPG